MERLEYTQSSYEFRQEQKQKYDEEQKHRQPSVAYKLGIKRNRDDNAILYALLREIFQRSRNFQTMRGYRSVYTLTKIMYSSNISNNMLKKYLLRALELGLIMHSDKFGQEIKKFSKRKGKKHVHESTPDIIVTEKGLRFMEIYSLIEGLLEPEDDDQLQ